MKQELNTLLTCDESEQIGFNGYKSLDENNILVFDDLNNMPFGIDARNVEFIINFSNPNLPASYYRERKSFVARN